MLASCGSGQLIICNVCSEVVSLACVTAGYITGFGRALEIISLTLVFSSDGYQRRFGKQLFEECVFINVISPEFFNISIKGFVFPELADRFPVSLGVGLGSAPRGTLTDSLSVSSVSANSLMIGPCLYPLSKSALAWAIHICFQKSQLPEFVLKYLCISPTMMPLCVPVGW